MVANILFLNITFTLVCFSVMGLGFWHILTSRTHTFNGLSGSTQSKGLCTERQGDKVMDDKP